MTNPLCPNCVDFEREKTVELTWDEETDELKCPSCGFIW